MSYTILNTTNIQGYLFSLPKIKNFFENAPLGVKEIGDGNLNFVFLATSTTNPDKQLIIKQAVPYLRCAGESYPLSKERMRYEIRSLEAFSKLSNNVPHIYHSDEDMSVVVMEFLATHIIMRQGMIEGVKYPNFAQHISSFMANTLFKTSSLYLSSKEKHKLIADFIENSELCKLTEDFVFSAPFMEHETNAPLPELSDIAKEIADDVDLKVMILKLKDKFMNKSEALIHGDLHTGSIMINQEETYVIDSEFAFVGPMGFDIGALFANLMMSWISHKIQDKDESYCLWIEITIQTIWENFSQEFCRLWDGVDESALIIKGFANKDILKSYQKEYMQTLLQESIGFAGAKMIRRQLGIAGVEDIRGIKDDATRERANRLAIKIGVRLVKQHTNIQDINQMIQQLKA